MEYRRLTAFDGLDLAWAADGPLEVHSGWSHCVVGDSGPIAIGLQNPEQTPLSIGLVASFDADGNEQWSTPLGVNNIAFGPDGRLVGLGETSEGSMLLYSFAEDGTATPSDDVHAAYRGAGEMVVTEDAVYLTVVRPYDNILLRRVLVKLDEAGGLIWDRDPLAAADDSPAASAPSLAISPNGEPIVAGTAWFDGVPHTYVDVYGSDGELLSSRFVDVDDAAGGYGPQITVTGDGTLAVATSHSGSDSACPAEPCILVQKRVL